MISAIMEKEQDAVLSPGLKSASEAFKSGRRQSSLFEKTGPRTPKVGMPGGLTSVHGQLQAETAKVSTLKVLLMEAAQREAAHKAEIDAIKANASKDLDESTVKVTDMLTLVKTLMKDKGIESAKVDEEGSGTEATAVNLRNRLMSLTSDLQEQSTRWK